MFTEITTDAINYCITHNHNIDCGESETQEFRFQCRVDNPVGYQMTTLMTVFKEGESIHNYSHRTRYCRNTSWLFSFSAATCEDDLFGKGREGDISEVECDEGQVGNKSAICERTGEWNLREDSCMLIQIKELITEAEVGSMGKHIFESF